MHPLLLMLEFAVVLVLVLVVQCAAITHYNPFVVTLRVVYFIRMWMSLPTATKLRTATLTTSLQA